MGMMGRGYGLILGAVPVSVVIEMSVWGIKSVWAWNGLLDCIRAGEKLGLRVSG